MKFLSSFFITHSKLNQKYAVSKKEEYNPICYYIKKDATNPSRRSSVVKEFTAFNYGMIPQTWYDSKFIDMKINLCVKKE